MSRPVQSGPATNVDRERNGNVIWLRYPARDRKQRSEDPVASLKKSGARLAFQIERAGKLRADIEAAVNARRYELYKGSTGLRDARATERTLAAAQRTHMSNLLTLVRAIAAVRPDDRAGHGEQSFQFEALESSIRQFRASLRHARQLSHDVQAQFQRRDWSGSASAFRMRAGDNPAEAP